MRVRHCEKPGAFKRGAWTREEDMKLIAYINRHGICNWCQMPKYAGLSRSGKSCRLRWLNYLRPDVKRGNFTKDEDETIINKHQIMGTRRSVIAARLPGRTDNEIKNRWQSHLKKLSKDPMSLITESQISSLTIDSESGENNSSVEANSKEPFSALQGSISEGCEVPISQGMCDILGASSCFSPYLEVDEIEADKNIGLSEPTTRE